MRSMQPRIRLKKLEGIEKRNGQEMGHSGQDMARSAQGHSEGGAGWRIAAEAEGSPSLSRAPGVW